VQAQARKSHPRFHFRPSRVNFHDKIMAPKRKAVDSLLPPQSGPIPLKAFEVQEKLFCGAHSINNLVSNTGVLPDQLNPLRVGYKPGGVVKINLTDLQRERIKALYADKQSRKYASSAGLKLNPSGDFPLDIVREALAHLGLDTQNARKYKDASVVGNIQHYCATYDEGVEGPLVGFLFGDAEHYWCATGPDFTGRNADALGYIDSRIPPGADFTVPALVARGLPAKIVVSLAVHFHPIKAAAAWDSLKPAPPAAADDDEVEFVPRGRAKKRKLLPKRPVTRSASLDSQATVPHSGPVDHPAAVSRSGTLDSRVTEPLDAMPRAGPSSSAALDGWAVASQPPPGMSDFDAFLAWAREQK
jgi:hypothetical protein